MTDFLRPSIGFSATLGAAFAVAFAACSFALGRADRKGPSVPGALRNAAEGLVEWLDGFARSLNKWIDKHQDALPKPIFDISLDPAEKKKLSLMQRKRWIYRALGVAGVYIAGVLLLELFGGFYLPTLFEALDAYKALISERMSSMELAIDAPPFTLYGFDIGMMAVLGFAIVTALSAFAFYVSRRAKRFTEQPGTFQYIIEMTVDFVDNLCNEKLGHYSRGVAPYVMAIGAYILFGCLIEMFALPPLALDLNMPAALALMTFFLINAMSIRYKGISGRLKYYVTPMPFIAPVRIMTDLAIPVSLSCRLFGNIVSGFILMDLVYLICDLVVPGVLSVYFTLFHAGIQTYIFCMLTLSFIGEALE